MGRESQSVPTRRLHDVVTSPGRRAELLASGEWGDTTLAAEVSRHAADNPEAVAVVDLGCARTHTYAELEADSNRVANALIARGVQPADVVSVQLPNWYETVTADLGVLKAGAVLNMLLPIYRGHELSNVVASARSRVLITPRVYRNHDHVAMAEKVIAGASEPLQHLVVDDPASGPGGLPWAADAPSTAPGVDLRAGDVSELIFSSGTEAQPKATMHTEQTANASVGKVVAAMGVTGADRVWMPSPIGHSTGFNFGVRIALLNGLPLALQDRWDAAEALRTIRQVGATYTVAATTFLSDLLDVLDAHGEDLPSLRLFGCGGAPIPTALVDRAEARGVTVLRLYGSTEVLIGSWCRPSDPRDKRLHTDGRPLPGAELQIRTADGVAAPGVPGELYVRSPTTSVGFFNDPGRTAATFEQDGWVKTGDIGSLDEAGYFTMVGRSKEILIRGGLNVAPAEVEELILSMPVVREVAVVGLPDPRLGEIGCACIVPEPGHAPTLDDVVAHLRAAGLSTFKLPEAVHLLSQLPKTPTGKVRKLEIVRQLVAAGDTADPRGEQRQRS
jgi:acyl-CoA synthetase (AMP-forming)/AMP-acid ligase II